MASIIRNSISKLGSTNVFQTRLCKVPKNHNVLQVAFMTRESRREKPYIEPPPLRYWEKSFLNYYRMRVRDPNLIRRFHENSKIVVIDGPPASGKSKVAEKIAQEFHMLYMPAPTHDEYYINSYGFDIRSLDPQLTPRAQSIDNRKFLSEPNGINVSWFQMMFLYMRFEQYINALIHMLCTGQGVVLNRCVYSDMVFVDAMNNAGYITNEIYKHYHRMRCYTLEPLLRPHLVIYLDTPVDVVQANIKKRGINYEVNSKVFTPTYLKDIENSYKSVYLQRRAKSGNVLIYDWSEEKDAGLMIEDIEALNFDDVTEHDKFCDWYFKDSRELLHKRYEYFEKNALFAYVQDPKTIEIPDELWLTGEDNMNSLQVYENVKSEGYYPGFNPYYDKGLLFRIRGLEPPYFRPTCRDFIHRDKCMA